MRFVFIVLSLLALVSCGLLDRRTPEEKRRDECAAAKGRAIVAFTTKMWKEKGLEPIGAGGGGCGVPSKGSRMLAVTFRCYRSVDIVQARNLLIECVEEFKTEINQRAELESCLSTFPFTYKNISISLLFTDTSTGTFVQSPSLAIARADEGKMSYVIEHDDVLDRARDETYEEALKIASES